jgi:hypothetical protein
MTRLANTYMYWQTDFQKQTNVHACNSKIARNPVAQNVGLRAIRLFNKSDCAQSGHAEFRIAHTSGYPLYKPHVAMISKYMYWHTDLQTQAHVHACPSKIARNPVALTFGLRAIRLLKKLDCT